MSSTRHSGERREDTIIITVLDMIYIDINLIYVSYLVNVSSCLSEPMPFNWNNQCQIVSILVIWTEMSQDSREPKSPSEWMLACRSLVRQGNIPGRFTVRGSPRSTGVS